jgi:hypothetical protein
VEKEPWDVSVKSLVAFPQILLPMNQKLDWTQKLGDAFLGSRPTSWPPRSACVSRPTKPAT